MGVMTGKAPGLHIVLGMMCSGQLAVAGGTDSFDLGFKLSCPGRRTAGADRLMADHASLGPGHFRRHRTVQVPDLGQGMVAAAAETTLTGQGSALS